MPNERAENGNCRCTPSPNPGRCSFKRWTWLSGTCSAVRFPHPSQEPGCGNSERTGQDVLLGGEAGQRRRFQPPWGEVRAALSGCRAVTPGRGRLSVRTVSKGLHLCAASVTPGLLRLQSLWGSASSLCSTVLRSPLPWSASAACELGVVSRSPRAAAGAAALSACSRLSFLGLLPLARAAHTADPQGKGCEGPRDPFLGCLPPACSHSDGGCYLRNSQCVFKNRQSQGKYLLSNLLFTKQGREPTIRASQGWGPACHIGLCCTSLRTSLFIAM